jgi:hypothetical protein
MKTRMTPPANPDESPLHVKPPGYHSYLLRFWEERSEQTDATIWRFSLEDPLTAQRHGFADLDSLTTWLKTEIRSQPASVTEGGDS